jgi:hypothetical protein
MLALRDGRESEAIAGPRPDLGKVIPLAEVPMSGDRHIYGEINNKTGMKRVFTAIRRDVGTAKSRPALTELYKRAGYLIALTHAPSWEQKFGKEAFGLRDIGEDEFRKTAHKINQRAAKIGTDADYDEKWGN